MSQSQQKGQTCSSVLIAGKPGRLRDSLEVLVESKPGICSVEAVGDSRSAFHVLNEKHPDLMILDTDLPGKDTWALVQQARASTPPTRCIILTFCSHEQKLAKRSGADAALLKGFSVDALFAAIDGQALDREDADRVSPLCAG